MRLYQQPAGLRRSCLRSRRRRAGRAHASWRRRAAGYAPRPRGLRAPAVPAATAAWLARALDAPHERRRRRCRSDSVDARQVEHRATVPPDRRRAGIGQEHDRRLEALGAVHGHHAHLVAPLLHVALHLARRPRAGRRESRCSDGGARVVVGERQVEELVDRVGRLGPEAGQQLRARRLRDRGSRRRTRTAARSRRARASASACRQRAW